MIIKAPVPKTLSVERKKTIFRSVIKRLVTVSKQDIKEVVKKHNELLDRVTVAWSQEK